MSNLWKGPKFTEVNAGSDDMNIASIAWGISLGIQALIQIIVNRIAILMVNRQNAKWLKIWSFVIILCINISVFMIWIPARLQINDTWADINKVWDRIEKVIFLLVDAGLNLYFIHLVRSRLIANGLTKYTRLFRYNLGMIAVSMTMDILLIAMMSLPNDIVYVQFHPLAYLVKLHIEMNMADLIIKVVKASNSNGYDYSGSKSGNTQPKQNGANKLGKGHIPSAMFVGGNLTLIQAGVDDDEDIEMNRMEGGIQKTTRTEVVVKQTRPSDSDDRDVASDAESMRPLRNNTYTVPEPKRRRSSQIAILTAP
ncbi:hypothetical protein FGSG_06594 [Fusarium graminearum PH-1]|uniref:Chromosome 4, complete genome n=1 Tax=Gibberella zeae (strain ATCC MYA-4620 / CBS 123657 / FGSC 9075 / NRRL 31084 / PH-1) TaxID=229533 RepID=I1RR80_GIBZE|nr:hypothetical protein FGSG_06594 [Fusarium graminearum PH-1]ESU12703.1 hypothetical protein FGSG_06594 [Fusarium graminearum PH-1]CEF85470.1 unnamed protein product [Fusarium graminearum]|eukprot:XP_011326210.1 hypothetical protein FGSG_06594 [Fusarium graminearum PH-1]